MMLFGKPVAERILSETKESVCAAGIVPGLAVVLVGDDPASRVYVGIKEVRAAELGFRFLKKTFPAFAEEAEVSDAIRSLNEDPRVHGIIVQLPLPPGMNADRIIGTIDPRKDADGFLTASVRLPVFPEAMIELAKSSGAPLQGASGVVLVNSERFGSVMVEALRREGVDAGCVLFRDLTSGAGEERVRKADVVFTAVGQPESFPRTLFKKGAIVIDGGISKKNGRIAGDVSGEGGDESIFLSPVPGGVGPVTVACLLRRVGELALEKEKTA